MFQEWRFPSRPTAMHWVGVVTLTLIVLPVRDTRAQAISQVARFYAVGCNGTPVGTGATPDVRENELVNWTIKWGASGADFEKVRVVLEAEDTFTSNNVIFGNDSTGTTLEGVVGDLDDGHEGWSRHYWRWSGSRCTNGSKYRFKATVYYIDADTSPDDPFVYDSSDTALLEFDQCPNSSVTAALFPPEVCKLQVSNPGSGVLFAWTRMEDTDVYNLYRGIVPIGFDDTSSSFGGPRPAYHHSAYPASTEVQGFCSEPGSLTLGTIGCTCPDCDAENGARHREYLDINEPSPGCTGCGYYYLISGERNCLVAGQGIEGTLGTDSFSNERPYGGGECPPM